MQVFFSGIGGAGIGPLALLAHQAGYVVFGSDKQDSQYITYLKERGITNIHTGDQNATYMPPDIDWFVYSSALPKENPNHAELAYVRDRGIKHSKRDEFLNHFLQERKIKMLAVAGTHGKTTTTAMFVWLCQQVGIPISYSVPAKLSFTEMSNYNPTAKYFIYECDEYDRNFLSFKPHLSLITGIDWDHHDVFPTREDYQQAFRDFIAQSENSIVWDVDFDRLALTPNDNILALDSQTDTSLTLPGKVNRLDAWLVIHAVSELASTSITELIEHMNGFPGVSRRFEAITGRLYTDYAHTPKKIEGALQLAREVAGDNVVVVYEGLHNTRQHFIKAELVHLFDSVKKLYVVPSYLAREDASLKLLSPQDIINLTSNPENGVASKLDDSLKQAIQQHIDAGDLVLCLTAGGGNSLDEWLRAEFVI
jgi:UDP-N-acetylmuramate--alanine ligase